MRVNDHAGTLPTLGRYSMTLSYVNLIYCARPY